MTTVSFSTPGTYLFTVPSNVTAIDFIVNGAAGGQGPFNGSPGNGGQVVVTAVPVTPNQVLQLNVGGVGAPLPNRSGGYNGGGTGGFRVNSTFQSGAGGGGASDVRVDGPFPLANRIIVAGGGGGGGGTQDSSGSNGAAGGSASAPLNPSGGDGQDGANSGSGSDLDVGGKGGKGGTQSSGGVGGIGGTYGGGFQGTNGNPGTLGQGGNGNVSPQTGGGAGGGGGGGFYGGGAGGSATTIDSSGNAGGGGAGSSLVPTGGTFNANGSSNNGSITLTYLVNPTITSSVTPSPAVIGQSVFDTVTLADGINLTGTITFQVYGPSIGVPDCSTAIPIYTSTVNVNGNGDYKSSPSFTPTSIGTYYFVASYSGDTNNNPVSTGCGDNSFTVFALQTTITTIISNPTIVVDQSTTITATLGNLTTSPASGTVTFFVYGPSNTPICSSPIASQTILVNSSSQASATFTFNSVPGTYYFITSYSGDTNNSPAITNCGDTSVSVIQATPTITASLSSSSINVGNPVTIIATLANGFDDTGTITFTGYGPSSSSSIPDCSTPAIYMSTVNVSGNGNYSSSPSFVPVVPGTYYFLASYSGDVNNTPAQTICGQVVLTVIINPNVTSLVVSVSPSSISIGDPINIITTLINGTSDATGTITIIAYGPSNTPLCRGMRIIIKSRIVVNGSSTYTTVINSFNPGQIGTYWFTAIYSGDSKNLPATSNCGSTPVIVSKVKLNLILDGNAGNNNDFWLLPPEFFFVQVISLSSNYSSLSPSGKLIVEMINSKGCVIFRQVFNLAEKLPITAGVLLKTPSIKHKEENFLITVNYSGDSNFLAVDKQIFLKVVK